MSAMVKFTPASLAMRSIESPVKDSPDCRRRRVASRISAWVASRLRAPVRAWTDSVAGLSVTPRSSLSGRGRLRLEGLWTPKEGIGMAGAGGILVVPPGAPPQAWMRPPAYAAPSTRSSKSHLPIILGLVAVGAFFVLVSWARVRGYAA